MESILIVSVCNGGIHRSVVAEYSLRQALQEQGLSDGVNVVSRGIAGMPGVPAPRGKNMLDYPKEWSLTAPVLNELRLDVSDHRARPLDLETVRQASLILTMDRRVLIEHPGSVVHAFPSWAYKARLFTELDGSATDVHDCYGADDPAVFRQVTEYIHGIAHRRLEFIVTLARLLQGKSSSYFEEVK